MSVVSKILGRIIIDRIRKGVDTRLRKEQADRNKTQTAVTNICLKCITFINLTFRMLQHTSSEVIIIML